MIHIPLDTCGEFWGNSQADDNYDFNCFDFVALLSIETPYARIYCMTGSSAGFFFEKSGLN